MAGLARAADDIEMVVVRKGTFTMGNAEELSAPIATNLPAHTVIVSKFFMSMYEVTNQQYADFLNEAEAAGQIEVRDDLPGPAGVYVVGADGYPGAGRKLYHLSGENQDGESELNRPWIGYDVGAAAGSRFQVLDSQGVFGNNDALDTTNWPANFVMWNGAVAFAAFRDMALPTEAQWEYAAQGGVGNPFGTDDGSLSLDNANYSGQDQPGDVAANAPGHPVAVGSYPANPFGLHDLAGNVWEWTADAYDADFYGDTDGASNPFNRTGIDGTAMDPSESDGCSGGPSTVYNCNTRLKRGGSWNFHEVTIRSEARNTDYVFRGNDHFGFRVVGATKKPKKPNKLQAAVDADGVVELSWKDRSANESSFELECKDSGKWSHLARVGANVETVTTDALESGTKYKCRVRARNSKGQSGWKRKTVDLS
jgi:formylglycine-generating enzyme required for sulfatase activity